MINSNSYKTKVKKYSIIQLGRQYGNDKNRNTIIKRKSKMKKDDENKLRETAYGRMGAKENKTFLDWTGFGFRMFFRIIKCALATALVLLAYCVILYFLDESVLNGRFNLSPDIFLKSIIVKAIFIIFFLALVLYETCRYEFGIMTEEKKLRKMAKIARKKNYKDSALRKFAWFKKAVTISTICGFLSIGGLMVYMVVADDFKAYLYALMCLGVFFIYIPGILYDPYAITFVLLGIAYIWFPPLLIYYFYKAAIKIFIGGFKCHQYISQMKVGKLRKDMDEYSTQEAEMLYDEMKAKERKNDNV